MAKKVDGLATRLIAKVTAHLFKHILRFCSKWTRAAGKPPFTVYTRFKYRDKYSYHS